MAFGSRKSFLRKCDDFRLPHVHDLLLLAGRSGGCRLDRRFGRMGSPTTPRQLLLGGLARRCCPDAARYLRPAAGIGSSPTGGRALPAPIVVLVISGAAARV